MDIKLKNIKYSKAAKTVSVFLIWAAFAALFASMVFLVWYYDEIREENYFETSKYIQEFRENVFHAFDYGVTLRSEEYIKGGNTITAEMMEQGKRELAERKRDEELERIRSELRQAASAEEPMTATAKTYEAIDETEQSNEKVPTYESSRSQPSAPDTSDEEVTPEEVELIRQNMLKEHLGRFKEVKTEIDSWVNFQYMVIDIKTGAALTNVNTDGDFNVENAISKLKAQKIYVHLAGDYEEAVPLNFIHIVDMGLTEALKGTGLELYAAVGEPLSAGDAFYEAQQRHATAHKLMPAFIAIAILSFIIGLFCFICLIISAGRGEKDGQIRLKPIDRLYNDIHTVLAIFAAVISVILLKEIFYDWEDIWELAGVFCVLSVDLLIALSYILSMARHIRSHSFIKHTFIYTFSRMVVKFASFCFNVKFRLVVILFLLGYGLMNGILFAAMIIDGHDTGPLTLVLLILLNIISVYLVLKALVSLSDIMGWVKEISRGNLEIYLEKPHASAAFAGFAWDIQNIQSGLRKAVSEAVKGERLKTELITNVSHDLKTPLTSIISYVDLLKKGNPGEDTRRYIEILDEKSSRLKQLIEDLIEASKAASGNIAVSLDGVDLHALIMQAEAEFRDKIIDRGLEVRIKATEKPVIIYADGRLMWRAMDNLLSNVVKYSQKNSRVYIDIEHTPEYGAITIKNISENPLDVEPDQLLERFVRGEESRTTEGSGLGLSIAKSLAELQGGRLDIVIDGDLFKASITMPLARERETAGKSLIS